MPQEICYGPVKHVTFIMSDGRLVELYNEHESSVIQCTKCRWIGILNASITKASIAGGFYSHSLQKDL
jgi:hypothetical protein